MKFRSHLALMAVGILLPILVLFTAALVLLMRAERDAAQRGVRETAYAVALAVDREIAAAEAALRVLATSRYLARGNLEEFYDQALVARTNESAWILLFDRAGQQLVNTRFPYGSPLARRTNPERVLEVIDTQRPSVSDMYIGAIMQRYILTVDVPVPLEGGRRYVLTQAFFPDYFERAFGADKLPREWIVAIADKQGRTIARTHRASEFVGKPLAAPLREAAEGRKEGELTHHTRDGIHVYDFFTRSPASGWLVVVGVPTAVLEAPARRAAIIAGVGTLIAVLSALGIAFFLGQRLARSLSGAAQSAVALGKGQPVLAADSPISEIRELHSALGAAGDMLARERNARTQAEAERERLFASSQAAREAAEAQNRAKDEFLAMLGHELRNPLAAVSNGVQLLELEPPASERSRLARDIIGRQTRQLVHLLDDLLDVGRVITGKIYLQREPLELAAAAQSAVNTLRAAGKASTHTVTIEASPVYIEADRARIEQIITNLVSNALTYTPAQGAVHIAVGRQGDDAVLSVRDSGIGLSEQERERVFELFFQAQGELHRKGGLGIGLTLVRRLVELHEGTVSAYSEGHGRGTTFTVKLPAIEPPARHVRAERPPPAGRKLSILLIEDNADARASLKALLALEGHAIHEAADGKSGLRAVEQLKPDVAVVDIGLPEIDGYEVARTVRERGHDAILLVALTGYGLPDDERRAMEAGFDAHLVKPADIKALKKIIGTDRVSA